MKKFITSILVVAILSSLVFAVFADEISNLGTPPLEETVYSEISGYVVQDQYENNMYTSATKVFTLVMEDDTNVTVSVDKNTQIISKKSGKAINYNKRWFEDGTNVTISFSRNANPYGVKDANTIYYPTGSNVPQHVVADVIVRNDDYSVQTPTETHIYRMGKHNLDSGKVFFTTDIGHKYTVNIENISTTWETNEPFNINNMGIGSIVVVDHNFDHDKNSLVPDYYIGLDRVLLLSYGQMDEELELHPKVEGGYSAYAISNWQYHYISESYCFECEDYIPLRKAVEALGPNYSIDWDGRDVLLNKNNVIYKIHDGDKVIETSNDVSVHGSTLCVIIRDGVTYVPVEFFRVVLGLNVEKLWV